MIDIRVLVRGDIDTPPFVRVFQYPDKEEESIFFNSVAAIKKKIGKSLKINANEALAIFCAYVIEQMRDRKSQDEIENAAHGIVSSDQVLIGVWSRPTRSPSRSKRRCASCLRASAGSTSATV
jgi:urease gamma subunit